MKHLLAFLFFLSVIFFYGQNDSSRFRANLVNHLLDSLWINPQSFFNKNDTNWRLLCDNLHQIDMSKLQNITYSIYNGSNTTIENESNASEGLMGTLNKNSSDQRLRRFNRKIDNGFRDHNKHPENKVVLVEGDSWFEYPMFLYDITDYLMTEENLAVYSLAYGGDWVSNMIESGEYRKEYAILKPDIFIISGGGNDMLQNHRLMNFIAQSPLPENDPFLDNYRDYVILRQNNIPVAMCKADFCPPGYRVYIDSMYRFKNRVDTGLVRHIVNGRRFIDKQYYIWLVSLKLEYKILFETLRKINLLHFDSLKIITQGYDYAIPSDSRKFGIRMFENNGKWLKEPLEIRGIHDQATQEDIIKALMFDFNEMLIELGKEYPNIYHVDSRGFTGFLEKRDHKKQGAYWYDELHPTDEVFKEITKAFIAIINDEIPKNERVVHVIDLEKQNNHQ